MSLNEIGKLFHTNDVHIGPEVVRKQFKPFAITMTWGFLERKPYLSAEKRYQREKRIIVKLEDNPNLHTPALLGSNDQELILELQSLPLTDLIAVFKDPFIHADDKLGYFRQSLQSLREIHESGETHGDPYLKNFFRIENPPNKGCIYTCDFEFERRSPFPKTTDVLILVANTVNALSQANGISSKSALSLVNEVYGKDLDFPFDQRDKVFFRLRFDMGPEFFHHFSNQRTINVPR